MNINKVTQFNNGFVGASSHKPIVGHIAFSAFSNVVSQAKNNGSEVIVAGQPLSITTNTQDSGAGEGLNPNVFLATKLASGGNLAGFALKSETDIVSNDYPTGAALPTQIFYVGLLGSGVETYLPISASATGLSGAIDLSKTLSYSDDGLILGNGDGGIKPLGNAVDGIKAKADGTGFEDCKVIKIRL